MFAGLVVFMIIGYPVAFSLAAVGFFFGFLSIDFGYFTMPFMQAIPGRVFGSILSNELLLAIPFFTFMGAILEKCGLAEDMLESMGQLFGPVKGGLGYSTIIVGFILGAITGTVAAQVIAMAMITLPVMLRYKYDMRYATGVLAASGTITQLVPPSLVLIVLADQLGRSVGDMYLGAWGPSLLQIALFAAYTFYLSIVRPDAMPPVPRTLFGRALLVKCAWGIIPAAVLIFLVLGHDHDGPGDSHRGGRHGHHRRHRAGRGAQCAAYEVRQMGVRRGRRGGGRRLPDRPRGLQVAALQGRLHRDVRRDHLAVLPRLAGQGAARPDRAGLPGDHAHHRDGRLHPGRRDLLLDHLPGRRRQSLGRASDVEPARRRLGLPDRRQPVRVLLPSSSTSSRSPSSSCRCWRRWRRRSSSRW